ncbi:nucleotide exchange factor GrpE [candidate division KSB1 bacterium]|nr:nucleotide exchange factor GrpE [candidate division KSB1 bacterium]RQW04041.1 MAG: nucleotide exchange factor GrpE [candidate division KSB1 bacterium]
MMKEIKDEDIPTTDGQKQKRKNYKKELERAVAEKEQLLEKLLRTAAEFDNFRKRVYNEKQELIEKGNADLITAVLPILDDLERFAALSGENCDFAALQQGVSMILKNFIKILGDYGLVEMAPLNKPFDPEKQEAIMQMERKDTPSDIVIEQHVKGYELKDKVLRHAKVVVSK